MTDPATSPLGATDSTVDSEDEDEDEDDDDQDDSELEDWEPRPPQPFSPQHLCEWGTIQKCHSLLQHPCHFLCPTSLKHFKSIIYSGLFTTFLMWLYFWSFSVISIVFSF